MLEKLKLNFSRTKKTKNFKEASCFPRETKKRTTFIIDESLYKRMKEFSGRSLIPMTEIVSEGVKAYLKKHEK